jgi:23S rRNA pseudouridine1911/1915/1917 synthase
MKWLVSSPDRLDAFLASDNRMLSRVQAQKAIEDGLVLVNDEVVTKAAQRIQEGDMVELTESGVAPVKSEIVPTDLHIEVLYEDEGCMVINKPMNLSVHPGPGMAPGEITLLHGVAFLFQERSLPFRDDAVLVHRLDKDTTGCLLIAKTKEAHMALQKQFEARTVDKRYLALVAGVPSPATATIDAPIGRSVSDRTKMAVLGSSASREARTTYRTISATKDAALLECELHTGRTHQIRVHLLTIGHPVLGDTNYTNELSDRLFDQYHPTSICLHAWKLSFLSPVSDKKIEVKATVPQAFQETMERVGLNMPKV